MLDISEIQPDNSTTNQNEKGQNEEDLGDSFFDE